MLDRYDFETYRSLLFSIAYRMLGSAMDAEDIVQETFLRYQKVDQKTIEDPKSFLAVITTRLAINRLNLAREKRETYIGPWLPEPLPTEGWSETTSPASQNLEKESLSMAFLVLLEKLSPEERAVFLLREVFQYPYAEIASAIQKSEATCRQLLRRSKLHLAANRPRFKSSEKGHQRLFEAFLGAVQKGDVDRLKTMLVQEASLWADGGGRIRGAATKPIYGRENIAHFLIASVKFAPEKLIAGLELVNHQWSAVLRTEDGKPFVVMMLDVSEDGIETVRLFGNPQKLGALAES